MKRNYDSGESTDVIYFTGPEVEHTPAHNMMTLFVTGWQPVSDIESRMHYSPYELPINHIFFGANHSFDPADAEEIVAWETMIRYFLEKGHLCSLDIPFSCIEEFNECSLNEYDNFIPQIRIPIPYAKLWNYNTMIKIDDKGFRATNPGVWCHSLHDLMSRDKFTGWDKYSVDKIVK